MTPLAAEGSARASIQRALDRTQALADELGCFLEVRGDEALAEADALDRELEQGAHRGPLFGAPFAVKANLCLEGAATSCGSRMLAGWRAPYTATAIERLRQAGAVPVAIANMDEFAMGSSGENSAFGPTRNPWDLARAPGGSSSGSAAAVAAGLVPFALGSDTGGSVRQPAALCGVSGFKPSWGRVSRYGLVAFASSLDQVSPLARSVGDLELIHGVLAGPDPLDATTEQTLPPPPLELGGDPGDNPGDALNGLRIGVLADTEGVEPGVAAAVHRAVETLGALGADCTEVRLGHLDHALSAYYVVATAEASSNLARFDGVRFGQRVAGDGGLASMLGASRGAGFGAEVKRRILLGTYALSAGYQDAWYERAARVRSLIAAEYAAAFERVDLIVGATSPTVAFELGARTADPLEMYRADVLTVPPSLVGLPAASVPCGLSPADGSGPELPVGLQLVAPRLEDARVLAVARHFQEATEHHLARPPHAAPEPGSTDRAGGAA